jgi:hypothetical protein
VSRCVGNGHGKVSLRVLELLLLLADSCRDVGRPACVISCSGGPRPRELGIQIGKVAQEFQ